MIAKKVKEMLAGVPDDAEIIVSVIYDCCKSGAEATDLTLSVDSKTKAYCIEGIADEKHKEDN